MDVVEGVGVERGVIPEAEVVARVIAMNIAKIEVIVMTILIDLMDEGKLFPR